MNAQAKNCTVRLRKNFSADGFFHLIHELIFGGGLLLLLMAFSLTAAGRSSAYAMDTDTYGAPVRTPYEIHGALSVSGSAVTDSTGAPFQLQGVSISSFVENPQYINYELLRVIRDNWGINAIRLCLGSEEHEAWLNNDQEQIFQIRGSLKEAADNIQDLGLYLVICWYAPEGSDLSSEKELAASFFADTVNTLGSRGQVLYELCDFGASSWADARDYAPDLIDTIRSGAPQSVVLVDIPGSFAYTECAVASPVDRSNLLYSITVDSSAWEDSVREKLETTIQQGMPLIVTEFGVCQADGMVDTWQADLWKDLLDSFDTGYFLGPLCAPYGEADNALLLPTSAEDFWSFELSTAALWYTERLNSTDTYSAEGAFMPTDSAYNTLSQPLGNGLMAEIAQIPGTYNSARSCEYDITLINQTASDISGWRLRLTWAFDVENSDFWNCDVGGFGNNRLLAARDFNSVIPAGSSVSFGIIVTGEASAQLTGFWSE